MVVGLVNLAVITIGVETRTDTNLIESSGFLNMSLTGLAADIYILPAAILTNNFFCFWLLDAYLRLQKWKRLDDWHSYRDRLCHQHLVSCKCHWSPCSVT